jgi:hypothetical protein
MNLHSFCLLHVLTESQFQFSPWGGLIMWSCLLSVHYLVAVN